MLCLASLGWHDGLAALPGGTLPWEPGTLSPFVAMLVRSPSCCVDWGVPLFSRLLISWPSLASSLAAWGVLE